MEIPPSEIEVLTRLYENGLYLQAHARAAALPPPLAWRGTAARLIGGRLAHNLLAPGLGSRMHALAWRHDRSSGEAAYYYASQMSQRRGPLSAWRFLKKLPPFPEASAETRSDLLSLQARFAALYRDFDTAATLLDEAEALAPGRPWLWVEKSDFLQKQDAYEDALAAARKSLKLRPWHRPGVQAAAHLLQLLNRDDEALDLLEQSLLHIESGNVTAQLAQLQTEVGRHPEALANWEKVRQLSPWIEPAMLDWWEGRMSDALYLCGDLAGAAEAAARSKNPFFEQMAPRLGSPPPGARRVSLPVEFVRQHHMTCAPATLSAISQFWSMPVDHLALAEAICYDGTPDHVERNWAEENGWFVREFCVTEASAHALLDRGIPFTMATVETQSAHLQAVIGYDSLRGTLLVRDPYQRVTGEWVTDKFLERYASHGPRGMVLVPLDKAPLLDGIDLPEAEFYDHNYSLERALHGYDREAAQRHLDALEKLDAGHRLTLFARRRLAWYDSSLPRQLAVAEDLLVQFPKSGNLLWSKAIALRALTRRTDYREFLRALAMAEDSEPLFWREWAEELALDARQTSAAECLILRALRFQPTDAESLRALAGLLWNRREFAEANWLYRLCACLREKVEGYSRSFFIAARSQRQTDEALKMLERQFEKFAHQSGQPIRLLFWALSALNRQPEAFERLEEALLKRPSDGELQLFAADAFARYANAERAGALLSAAENRAPVAAFRRTAASIADYACDLRASLALWQAILADEPLALDAHQAVARLIGETQGRREAMVHFHDACERFPHFVPLHRLWAEWTRDESPAEAERVLRILLSLDPEDVWGRRELALTLAAQQRFEEAHAELAIAAQLVPHAPENHGVRGRVLLHEGRRLEAQEACREALRLSIDAQAPAGDLIEASLTLDEKREGLAFMQSELIRQVVFGDGLLAFRDAAFPILEPEALLASLREALAARPDLWHAGSAVVVQLTDMHQLDEALALAQRSTERFPLLPRLWLDLSLVHRARREREAEIPPLERALQLSPGWGRASRALSNTYERMGDYQKSAETLERAIAASPLDAYNHGALGDALWHLGKMEQAVASIERALRLDPGWDWAWEQLREWPPKIGAPDRAVTLARELTNTRAGEARSWFDLAQALVNSPIEERLVALDKALELNPRYFDAIDVRAWMLATAGRFEEALAACAPPALNGSVPARLLGRAAWVEAQRANLSAAISKMEAVVETAPDYYWGWNMLADWNCKIRNFPKALDAAKTMARLAPRSAIPLGYQADIQMQLGRAGDARASLRRAVEIDPAYEFAAMKLFEHYVEERDYPNAEKILTLLKTHSPGARTTLAELKMECRRVRRDDALALLSEICMAPVEDSFAVNAADERIRKSGWTSSAERIFFEALNKPGANPEVGACWVRRFTERGDWKQRKLLFKVPPATPIGDSARIAYLEALGALKKPGYLRSIIGRERGWLMRNPVAWGTVGYSFVQMKRYRSVVAWMRDWRQRRDAQPWMLQNLSHALRKLGRDREAITVNGRAIELQPDHTTPVHRVWLLFEIALRGDHVRASKLLKEIHEHDLVPYNRAILSLIKAVVAVFGAAPEQKRRTFKEERIELQTGDLQGLFRDSVLRREYRRTLKAMGRAAGRPLLGTFYSWMPLKARTVAAPASTLAGGPDISPRMIWIFVMLAIALLRMCSSAVSP